MADNYKILEERDIPFAGAIRLRSRVYVDPKTTRTEIQSVAEQIKDNAIALRKINALNILFYDRETAARGVFSLASADWAPWGEWSKAVQVAAGDYGNHQWKFDFRPKVDVPVIERPSTRELQIHDRAFEVVNEPEYTELDDDTPALEKVGEEFGVTASEVRQVVTRVMAWDFDLAGQQPQILRRRVDAFLAEASELLDQHPESSVTRGVTAFEVFAREVILRPYFQDSFLQRNKEFADFVLDELLNRPGALDTTFKKVVSQAWNLDVGKLKEWAKLRNAVQRRNAIVHRGEPESKQQARVILDDITSVINEIDTAIRSQSRGSR